MERYSKECPDIMTMFKEDNPNFIKKTEKKGREEREKEHKEKEKPKDDKKKGVKGKKDAKGADKKAENINIELDKPEKTYSRIEDAKKSFTSEYTKNNFRNAFGDKLKAWKECNNIKMSKNSVDKEENKVLIIDNFQRFLAEPDSQQYDLYSSLDDIIQAPLKFKTELSGSSTEI